VLKRALLGLAVVASLVACGGSSRQPRGAADRLWQVAQDIAHDANTHVVAADAVRTTRRAAIALAAGRAVRPIDRVGHRLWLVSVVADEPFSCECSVRPTASGRTDPRYMLALVDPATYRWGSWSDLRSDRADLSSLGTPMSLGR
jgi:hypothetical protein